MLTLPISVISYHIWSFLQQQSWPETVDGA